MGVLGMMLERTRCETKQASHASGSDAAAKLAAVHDAFGL